MKQYKVEITKEVYIGSIGQHTGKCYYDDGKV